MSITTANIVSSSDTFQVWIDKTNTLLNAYSTTIITTAGNSAGGLTTGNAVVNGFFAANTLIAGDAIRGGTVDTSGLLTITSAANVANSFTVSGNTILTGPVTFSSGFTANGSTGVAGQVLTSNGTTGSPYWTTPANGTVTSIAFANGFVGGTITGSGTVSFKANTGLTSNTSGVFLDTTYVAGLNANNTLYLGGTAAASFVQNTDSRILSGNLTFTGANTVVTGTLSLPSGPISANGSVGSNGQVLTSNGATGAPYWATPVLGGFRTQIFTSNTTWTPPQGVTAARFTIIGGGGSGGYTSTSGTAGVGGVAVVAANNLTGTYTITVGKGGGSLTSPGLGAAGSNSSVSGISTATGGAAGGNPGTAAAGSASVSSGQILRRGNIITTPPMTYFGVQTSNFTDFDSNGITWDGTSKFVPGAAGLNVNNPSGGYSGVDGIVMIEY